MSRVTKKENVVKLIKAQVATLHQGVVKLEMRFHHSWNALNVFVRMFEHVGVEQGWFKDRDDFQNRYAQAAAELVTERMNEERAAMAKIKAGEAPDPMSDDRVTELLKTELPSTEQSGLPDLHLVKKPEGCRDC